MCFILRKRNTKRKDIKWIELLPSFNAPCPIDHGALKSLGKAIQSMLFFSFGNKKTRVSEIPADFSPRQFAMFTGAYVGRRRVTWLNEEKHEIGIKYPWKNMRDLAFDKIREFIRQTRRQFRKKDEKRGAHEEKKKQRPATGKATMFLREEEEEEEMDGGGGEDGEENE